MPFEERTDWVDAPRPPAKPGETPVMSADIKRWERAHAEAHEQLDGRLSEATLNATYATPSSVAADLANPETAANEAVIDVVNGLVPAGVIPWVDATSILGAARPAGYAGPVVWVLPAGVALPINRLSGDFILRRSETVVPWSPAQLPGVKSWFDAQSITAAADSAVAQWDDLSGHDAHMVQSTSGAQPIYRAAGLNGHPSVQFDGTNDYLKSSVESTTAEWTVYVVGQWTAASLSSSQWMLDALSSADAGTRLGFYRSSVGYAITRGTNLVSTSADNLVHRHKLEYKGTSIITTDGTQVASGGTGSALEISHFMMGARGTLASFFAGHIGEVIWVQGAVSAEDDAKVAAYLQNRWGVA